MKNIEMMRSFLFSGSDYKNWQMNDSEKIALVGLLLHMRPSVSIEIGVYLGGSLSVISKYSDKVYALDIDESVIEKFSFYNNVDFIVGNSRKTLPDLLNILKKSNEIVNFILVDGDHSSQGVKADIEAILEYIPNSDLVVVFHDSYNPECRAGLISVDWSKSDYVKAIDLDFVPGRVVESGAGGHGEMWGGLAICYLSPTKRVGDVYIGKSSNKAYMNDLARIDNSNV